VVCGVCVRHPTYRTLLPCRNADHTDLDQQKFLRLYNLDCAICLETATIERVSLFCGKYIAYLDVPANRIGHVYCQTCILEWTRINTGPRRYNRVICPVCKDRRTRLYHLRLSKQGIRPTPKIIETELSRSACKQFKDRTYLR
jgi:hypothetical protein